MKFYHITDTHYFSKNIWEDSKCMDSRCHEDQIHLKKSPEINKAFFDMIKEDKETEIVIISGDLVNSGEAVCHKEFIEMLEDLEKSGKKIYVTTATHDYIGEGDDENIFHAYFFSKKGKIKIEKVRRSELKDLYWKFGMAQADSIHESNSYSVKLADGFRMIALNDDGNGRSHCGLFEDGMNWLKEEIEKAKKNGEFVFVVTHHPVITPFPFYEKLAKSEMYGGYEEMQKLLLDEGVKLLFTGHTHMHNISKVSDENGNELYDISTSSTVLTDGMVRKVCLDLEKGIAEISSLAPRDFLSLGDGTYQGRDFLKRESYTGYYKKLIMDMKDDYKKFIKNADGLIKKDVLEKYEIIITPIVMCLEKTCLKKIAILGGVYSGFNRYEKALLKNEKFLDVVFEIADHVMSGDAPFTTDTVEYRCVIGLTTRIDYIIKKLNIPLSEKLAGIDSITDMLKPLLYNTRTGSDKEIKIAL